MTEGTLTTTTPDGVSTTRPVPPSWATVAPLLARWRLSVVGNGDGTWDVHTPGPRPQHARRRVWQRDLLQAIADVAARCEADGVYPIGYGRGGGGRMSDETTATWRYQIGQRVRWAGDGQWWIIVERRWIERQIMPPYAEYHVQREANRREWGWIVEADLDAAREDAGEGGG